MSWKNEGGEKREGGEKNCTRNEGRVGDLGRGGGGRMFKYNVNDLVLGAKVLHVVQVSQSTLTMKKC